MSGRAFISYSRPDRAYVAKLAERLRSESVDVWFDYELVAGDRFATAIQQVIDDCGVVIVVLTPHSLASEWVDKEINYSVSQGKRVLPLMLEPVKVPLLVSNLHCEDVTGGRMPPAGFFANVRHILGEFRPRPADGFLQVPLEFGALRDLLGDSENMGSARAAFARSNIIEAPTDKIRRRVELGLFNLLYTLKELGLATISDVRTYLTTLVPIIDVLGQIATPTDGAATLEELLLAAVLIESGASTDDVLSLGLGRDAAIAHEANLRRWQTRHRLPASTYGSPSAPARTALPEPSRPAERPSGGGILDWFFGRTSRPSSPSPSRTPTPQVAKEAAPSGSVPPPRDRVRPTLNVSSRPGTYKAPQPGRAVQAQTEKATAEARRRFLNTDNRYDAMAELGRRGGAYDVDVLMAALALSGDIATAKLVDFALGLVTRGEGVERIHFYLYSGNQQQRNYAATYFRRLQQLDLLADAVRAGAIDRVQAFAK